jgi:Ras-related protein Rab-8A
VKILIGTKSDLLSIRSFSFEEMKDLSEEFGIKYIETSAKLNQNVESAFQIIAHDMINACMN